MNCDATDRNHEREGLGKSRTLMTLPSPILRGSAAGFGAPAPDPMPSPIPAQKPFDSAAKADIIFRSKDLIDFFILADLVHVVSASPTSLRSQWEKR
jgi:hypothetical protein